MALSELEPKKFVKKPEKPPAVPLPKLVRQGPTYPKMNRPRPERRQSSGPRSNPTQIPNL